jgi:hypothetical protein
MLGWRRPKGALWCLVSLFLGAIDFLLIVVLDPAKP